MAVTVDEVLLNLEGLIKDLVLGNEVLATDVATYSDLNMLEARVDAWVATNQVPTGGKFIGAFNASCPSGWTRVSAFDGKFLVGKATYGGTGGTTTHTHSIGGVVAHQHGIGTVVVGSSGSHGHDYVAPSTLSGYTGGAYGISRGTSSGTIDGNWPSHDHNDSASGSIANGSAGDGTSGGASNNPSYTTVVWCAKS